MPENNNNNITKIVLLSLVSGIRLAEKFPKLKKIITDGVNKDAAIVLKRYANKLIKDIQKEGEI